MQLPCFNEYRELKFYVSAKYIRQSAGKPFIKLIYTKLIKESSETMHETIKGALFLIEEIVRSY